MTDCIPDAEGRCCTACGWQWKRPGKFPRRNCPKASDRPAPTPEEIVANLWQRLERETKCWLCIGGKEAARAKLERCAECANLRPGGCAVAMKPCGYWKALVAELAKPGECGQYDKHER